MTDNQSGTMACTDDQVFLSLKKEAERIGTAKSIYGFRCGINRTEAIPQKYCAELCYGFSVGFQFGRCFPPR